MKQGQHLGGLRALQTPKTAPSLLLRLSVGAAVSNTERSERTARTVGVTKGWVRMAEATRIRNETTKQKTNTDPVGIGEEREECTERDSVLHKDNYRLKRNSPSAVTKGRKLVPKGTSAGCLPSRT